MIGLMNRVDRRRSLVRGTRRSLTLGLTTALATTLVFGNVAGAWHTGALPAPCLDVFLDRLLVTYHVDLVPELVAAAAAGSKGRVAIAPFSDARTADVAVGRQVGQLRNECGIPGARVLANQDPVLWARNSLAGGLEAQGFVVERVDAPDAAGELPVVIGSVEEVFADWYFGVSAEVKLRVVVERSGRPVLETECIGQGTPNPGWFRLGGGGVSGLYRESLMNAMHQLVESCVPRLTAVL